MPRKMTQNLWMNMGCFTTIQKNLGIQVYVELIANNIHI